MSTTPTANQFDKVVVTTPATTNTTANKLNLHRPTTGGAVSYTRVTPMVGLPTTATVLQLSFDYNSNPISGLAGSIAGTYLFIGTPVTNDGTTAGVLADASTTLKLRFDNEYTTNNGNFRIVNFKPATTAGATPYYPFGTSVHVDVIFNYTSNVVNYDAPTSPITTGTLAPGTVDLYVNGVIIAAIKGQPLVSPTLVPTGMKLISQSVAQDTYFDNLVIKDANNVTLPVHLTSFTGKSDDNSITLNWSTASELNSNYFEVAKYDANTNNYIIIGKINATSNSSYIRNYQFVDHYPQNGANYYQLKQVDKDGNFKIFPVISVNNACTAFKFNVFQLQAGSCQYNIYTDASKAMELSVIGLDGKIWSKQNIQMVSGHNIGTISTANLSTGIYIIQLNDDNSHVFTKELFITSK